LVRYEHRSTSVSAKRSPEAAATSGFLRLVGDMLAHVNEHRQLFRAMAGKRSGAAVQSVLHKLVIDLVWDDLKATAARSDAQSTATSAIVEFIAGGLFGLLLWWLSGKAKLSGEELNELFRRFAIPAAKAAG
jgi:hypothetical protein